jgi:class 3 adenylate cyclase/predicted ATPase/ABC-type transport system involved in cytochrome c biogenesis ATPase subunit
MDLGAWLRDLGLQRYEQSFRDQDITLDLLKSLSGEDLRELGVASLGHRKRLLLAAAALPQFSSPQHSPDQPFSMVAQAERRQLTVVFVDLVGSTALSQALDPEELRETFRSYQNAVAGEIVRFEGHIAKFMGDGVIAYFGWPKAHEDEVERAVRAGLAVVEIVPKLSTPAPRRLNVRVGIATGLVVVGDLLGQGLAREEAVTGETPNLAARLQEVAAPGEVIVSAGARRMLANVFQFGPLGAMRLKGFPEPVPAFRVLGERPARSRFEAHRPQVLPMIGRDHELALIVDSWHQIQASEGQAVLLVGEAGIGKSRLIQASMVAVSMDEHFNVYFQCSPHHTGTALWPVAQQLAYAAGFSVGDSDAVKLEKLRGLLDQCTPETPDTILLISNLLGLEALDQTLHQDLSPKQRRIKTLAALVEMILGLARRKPVLMVLEDVHWIDPTTFEFLVQVLDRAAHIRVLMLLTSRPDNQPALGGHPNLTRLTLNRLSRAATEAIITSLLDQQSLSRAVVGEIASRTDGVPLFIEELTKAVLELGSRPGEVVPASLHDSLMARLDQVPGVKEVAQIASCIGREFAYDLLAAVSPLGESELKSSLEQLIAAELVFEAGEPPDEKFVFKHALVREAAHESLLKVKRQQLHARIAQVLEDRFPEKVLLEPELVAQHFTEAKLAERAVEYWQRAGQQARERSALSEALAHFSKGLELIEQIPDGLDRQRRELALQLAIGQVSIATKGFAAPGTGAAYARARELSVGLGHVSELFPAIYGLSVFHFQRGELREAYRVATELLELGATHMDGAACVTGHRMIGSALCQLGRFVESRANFETVVSLYDPVRDRRSSTDYAIDSRVMSWSWLTHLNAILGDPEKALSLNAQIPVYSRELGDLNTIAVSLAWECIFHQILRDHKKAREQANAVISLATDQGFPLYAAAGTVIHGWALAASGQVAGIQKIRSGLDAYAATGAEMWSPYFLGLLGEACGWGEQATEGLAYIADALDRVERTSNRWIEAELHRVKGDLLLRLPKPRVSEAETCFTQALVIAKAQRARLWELRAAISLASLWHRDNKQRKARDLLAPLYERSTGRVQTYDLHSAEALMRALSSS